MRPNCDWFTERATSTWKASPCSPTFTTTQNYLFDKIRSNEQALFTRGSTH
jgi:hypothetical protein